MYVTGEDIRMPKYEGEIATEAVEEIMSITDGQIVEVWFYFT